MKSDQNQYGWISYPSSNSANGWNDRQLDLTLGPGFDRCSDDEKAERIDILLANVRRLTRPKKINRVDLLIFIIYLIGQVSLCWAVFSLAMMQTPDWSPGLVLLVGLFGGLLATAPFVIYLIYLTRRFVPKNPLPSRKKPLMHLRGEIISLLTVGAVWVGSILLESYISGEFTNPADEVGRKIVFAVLLILALIIALPYLYRIAKSIYYRRIVDDSPGNAIGTILDLKTIQGMVHTVPIHVYEFIIQYTPTLARTASQNMIFRGEVKSKFWHRLRVGQEIPVRYAAEDPRIFALEGE